MSAFADRRFRRLVIGQSLSSFGDTALYLSLGIWVKDLTGSNSAAGAILFALYSPSVLFPLGGHFVDRFPRRLMLLRTNLLTGLMVLLLLFVHSAAQAWIIFVVAAIYGTSLNILSAAQAGLLKDMLPADQLASANATLVGINRALRLGSPLVGAGIYVAIGPHALTIVDSISFLAAVVALLTIQVTESALPPSNQSFFRSVLAGGQHVRQVPLLRQLCFAVSGATLASGLMDVSVFAVVDKGLGRSAAFYGILLSVHAAGGVAGAAITAWLISRIGLARAIGGALASYAVTVLMLTTTSLSAAIAGMAVQGAMVAIIFVGLPTALQRYSPAQLQGRVGALGNLIIYFPFALAVGIGSLLLTVVDYRLLLILAAVGVAASAFPPLLRPAELPLREPAIDPVLDAAT